MKNGKSSVNFVFMLMVSGTGEKMWCCVVGWRVGTWGKGYRKTVVRDHGALVRLGGGEHLKCLWHLMQAPILDLVC